MHFTLTLQLQENSGNLIPINYQYPLSAAIYRILAKGDSEYAKFLHEEGYGKGYKLFTFSDLKVKFKLVSADRMKLLSPEAVLQIYFHLPEASTTFIQGLFQSEEIVIADKKSKAVFCVQSVASIKDPWPAAIEENQIITSVFRPVSAVLAGVKMDSGNYQYLAPDEEGFTESLIYNWRGKIRNCYDEETAENAVLLVKTEFFKNTFRSRLVHIKSTTKAETKIRGFLNFKLKLTAEKRFLQLIYNAGIGLENAQGMGCLEVIS